MNLIHRKQKGENRRICEFSFTHSKTLFSTKIKEEKEKNTNNIALRVLFYLLAAWIKIYPFVCFCSMFVRIWQRQNAYSRWTGKIIPWLCGSVWHLLLYLLFFYAFKLYTHTHTPVRPYTYIVLIRTCPHKMHTWFEQITFCKMDRICLVKTMDTLSYIFL